MANSDLVRDGLPTNSTPTPPHNCETPPVQCGEAIVSGDVCVIDPADGKAYKATAIAANARAHVDGWATQSRAAGQWMTLYENVCFGYFASTNKKAAGTMLYLSLTNPGNVQTAIPPNQTRPIAVVMADGQNIRVRSTR
jgi:hypothetical protein